MQTAIWLELHDFVQQVQNLLPMHSKQKLGSAEL